MKVFLIGGTGLLGSEAAKELIRRGHSVTALALPPVPHGAELPPEMELHFGNYLEISDGELRALMQGCEGFLFAAGVDERVEGPAPIYEMFRRYNITPLERLLRIAKECGVRHCAVCGSYFSYFAKLWPEKELSLWHPYIRSRIDQEKLVFFSASGDFDAAVLELPYIFGCQPGRRPVWVFLADEILRMKPFTFYPCGGSAMITVRQAAQALAGALERNRGANAYPIGWENMRWEEMLRVIHGAIGCPKKKIITISDRSFRLVCHFLAAKQKREGHEGGLSPVKFAEVMCSETYIDRRLGCIPLGVEDDDIRQAITESFRLCMEILSGRTAAIDMRGE